MAIWVSPMTLAWLGDPARPPISQSLPKQAEPFNLRQTRPMSEQAPVQAMALAQYGLDAQALEAFSDIVRSGAERVLGGSGLKA